MPDVIVAGSINLDVAASAPRHPRPGETVIGTGLGYCPGGKGANQAVAAARAGASVRMLGAVGDDRFAGDVLRFLDEADVDVSAVIRRPGVPTGTAVIVVAAGGENTIVVVPGANATLDEAAVADCRPGPGDVLVTQCETPLATAVALFRRGRAAGATCLLNPAPAVPLPPELLGLVDILVLNETELATLSEVQVRPDASPDEIAGAVDRLRRQGLHGTVVATLGARGALALQDDRVVTTTGHAVDAVDTTGAGDCFVGSLAARLVLGAALPGRAGSLKEALAYANAAAALCVTRLGSGPSLPTHAEVTAFRPDRP